MAEPRVRLRRLFQRVMNQPTDHIYDELLILRAQGGDDSAMERIVMRWDLRFLRHIRRHINDRDLAQDVLQDSWLTIVRGLKGLDDPRLFRPWAYRILTRRAVDAIRKRSRFREVQGEDENYESSRVDRDKSRVDQLDEIRFALKGISSEQRVCLEMFYLDDLSVDEIAHALFLPVGTVKSRLFYAREYVRRTLNQE